MELHGICFDLYSTLVHEAGDNPFYRDIAAELHLDLEQWMPAYRKRHRESMIGSIPGMAERVILSVQDVGLERPPDAVRMAVKRCFPDFVASISVDPQAKQLLRRLRTRGLALALVSNASDHSETIFDQLGLRTYFDTIVFSYRVKQLKPHPEIYRHATDGLGVTAARCAFVGDGGDRELYGARRAGMATVLVDRRLSHSDAARADADLVVDDLIAIDAALDTLTGTNSTAQPWR